MGALTSKPYAFLARPWELKSVESYDLFDSYISSIRYDYRGTEIMRVLPVLNNKLNQDWISDKVRFFFDAIGHQRLTQPWIRSDLILNYLRVTFFVNYDYFPRVISVTVSFPLSWSYTLDLIRVTMSSILNIYKGNFNLLGVLGPYLDLGTIPKFKDFFLLQGSNFIFPEEFINSNMAFNNDFRNNYLFNQEKFFKNSGCFLVGINPRYEAPELNIRLREAIFSKNFSIFTFGSCFNLNYQFKNLGVSMADLIIFITGKSDSSLIIFNKIIPLLLGLSAVQLGIQNMIKLISNFVRTYTFLSSSTVINVLEHTGVKSFDLNYNKDFNFLNILYNFNSDNLRITKKILLNNLNFNNLYTAKIFEPSVFYIYQGSHGDISVNDAHIVLPTVMTHTENSSLFLNVLGELKRLKIVLPPAPSSLARTNVKIISIFNIIFNIIFNRNLFIFDSLNNSFDYYSFIKLNSESDLNMRDLDNNILNTYFVNNDLILGSFIVEFFLIDACTKSSQNLALVASYRNKKNFNFGNLLSKN